MDLPQPPADQELKNIIDKLAQFVARNGPEFEHMTKQKQKDNPKFSFLFGGQFFHYYQYRVTTEQAILKQKQRLEQQAIVQQAINRQSIQAAPWQQPQQPLLQQIQDTSQEQIRQSEQNLAAQHQLLLQQQQVQVDDVIRKAQQDKLNALSMENDIDLKELDGVLQPIIDSCTKDSISNGKVWIFSHATSSSRCDVVALYILKKVTEPGATFEAKLHLVYLINDVLHHCFRKNADDLRKVLETVVVPIFCSTSMGVDADKLQKLAKLHKLWESNKYFSQEILDQLQNPASSLAAYQASLISEYAGLITPLTAAIQAQYSLLQKQHQDFVAHLTGIQIPVPYAFQSPGNPMMPQSQSAAVTPFLQQVAPQVGFDQQTLAPPQMQDPRLHVPQLPEDVAPLPDERPASREEPEPEPEDEQPREGMDVDPPSHLEDRMQTMRHDGHPTDRFSDHVGGHRDYPADFPPDDPLPYGHADHLPPGRHPNGRSMGGPPHYMDDYSPHYGHPGYGSEQPEYSMSPPHGGYGHHRPYRDVPMGMGPQDVPPDYMEPPPCQPPYYDLPAGLMVPLVGLEDTDYTKPLDPDEIRLPPPALPTERLLAAVEQFYCPPTHERTRNNAYVISSEGWEQLGLYEFFKAKAQHKREKGGGPEEDEEEDGGPQLRPAEDPPQKPRRRYREVKSVESSSPEPEPPAKNGGGGAERGRRSESRSRSRSPEAPPRRSPSPQRGGYPRNRNRSPKRRSPDRRSVSPPSFGGGGSTPHERRLDESNKGHQLLKKMGWSGAGGLGSNEQGIQDPVDAGDVRDRQDMYKGIGVSLNDPYENFRKSKGQAFINRMKARAEELGKM